MKLPGKLECESVGEVCPELPWVIGLLCHLYVHSFALGSSYVSLEADAASI